MESTSNDQASLFDAQSQDSGVSLPGSTSAEFARRLKSLLTPPRTRRRANTAPDCPTMTTSRSTIATSTPASRKTILPNSHLSMSRSCDDIGRLEEIFEPRMAPYTPPFNVATASPTSQCASPLEEERLQKLEFSLFEPRNSPCTPPLVRRQATTSSAHEDDDSARQTPAESEVSAARRTPDQTEYSELAQDKLTVDQLVTILSDLRSRAQESSAECLKQLNQSSDGAVVDSTNSLPTVRDVAKIATVGHSKAFQRSYSGRMHSNRFLALVPRARSVTVC